MTNSSRLEPKKSLTFLQLVQSTLWAALGVQKSKNHERDFAHGEWRHFVFMGIGFTTLFVMLIALLVNLIVAHAG